MHSLQQFSSWGYGNTLLFIQVIAHPPSWPPLPSGSGQKGS